LVVIENEFFSVAWILIISLLTAKLRTLLCPAGRVGSIKRLCASDVCLSVAYIGSKSRTERPRKTKIGREVAHVTRDSDTTFKVKSSKVNLQGRGHIVAASRTTCLLLFFPAGGMGCLWKTERPHE